MRHIQSIYVLAAALVAPVCLGGEVAWISDAEQAWKTTVDKKRPLLIFVTSTGCKYCTLMQNNTFADDAVCAEISQSFVPLVVDAQAASGWVQRMQISAFPTMLVISPQSQVMDRMQGYLPPDRFKQRLTETRDKTPQR